jgi:hypothetical protein
MQVEVRGARLWFDVDGPALVPDGPAMRERPTVVLLHGGPGSLDHSYFKPDFARLAQVAQVVYLDLRGHGLCGAPSRPRRGAGAPVHQCPLRPGPDRGGVPPGGGDEVAAIAGRFYGGDGESVTAEEWARCWRRFGPWVLGELDPVTPVAAARELVDALPKGGGWR